MTKNISTAQLRIAVERAVKEAVERERGRCLWVLDDLIKTLDADFNKKILVEAQRHMAETKLRLARAICSTAKRGIVGGARPPEPSRKDELES
jgi:hypothetical protein